LASRHACQRQSVNLRIPGPTPLPPEVQQALAQDMISHRGSEFCTLLHDVTQRLKLVFQTQGDVLVLTGSGTGGLEAAVVNVLSPGDRVLAVSCGAFGQRFADIARSFGGRVEQLDVGWGKAMDPGEVERALCDQHDIRILLTTHNETSTGVLNDLASLATVVRSADGSRPLWLVDAVSSLGAVELPMDEWGCDVVVSASQKAWMAPPGLALLGVSPRAWEFMSQARCPRFYWDLGAARTYAELGQTPFTPAVSTLYGLQAALARMAEEGLPAIAARHRLLAERLRAGLSSLGLCMLVDERVASPTVTAVLTPDGLTPTELQHLLFEQGVEVATGQGILRDKIVRIAHMGYCAEEDIDDVLDALHSVLEHTRARRAQCPDSL
jgi:aspartate aminotransferase-like enzyme